MFLAHSFRLRDPWQCECDEAGALRWSRVFHRPTGLEDDDALWLVCSLLPSGAQITFNGQRLSASSPGATGVPPVLPPSADEDESTNDDTSATPRHQYEVTTLLKETNKIEIHLPPPSGEPASAGGSSPTPFPYDVRLGVVGHS